MLTIGKLLGLSPTTPPTDQPFYGFRWQNGAPVPAQLLGFGASANPGVYVGFQPRQLQADAPLFTRSGETLLYNPPSSPSDSLAQIADVLVQHDQQLRNPTGLIVTTQFLAQLQGFFQYAVDCLNLIYQTAVGQQLLAALGAGTQPVFVIPALGGNAAQPQNPDATLSWIVRTLFASQTDLNNVDRAGLAQLIVNAIPGASLKARLTTLANNINALPLYSEFIDQANYPAAFFGNNFLFQGAQVDGTVLSNWLFGTGNGPAFEQALIQANPVNSVGLLDYFRIALIVQLYAADQRAGGTSTSVFFRVRINPNDLQDDNAVRPPAVGLAHELVHAYHNMRGDQLGRHLYHPTTMLFELHAIGLGPFHNAAFTENGVRGQWNTVQGADPTNQWPHPVLRTIYDALPPGMTIDQIRQQSHTI